MSKHVPDKIGFDKYDFMFIEWCDIGLDVWATWSALDIWQWKYDDQGRSVITQQLMCHYDNNLLVNIKNILDFLTKPQIKL